MHGFVGSLGATFVAVSSRLTRDARGRLVVELTVPPEGERFLVLGNTFEAGGTRIRFSRRV